MGQRPKAPARVLAIAALVVGFVVLVVMIASSVGGGDSNGTAGHTPPSRVTPKGDGGKEKVPATYVVQEGDTLTSIAHRMGVPVARILELNPEVDPQILISGEKLKLR
jgi:LysM repeat protein